MESMLAEPSRSQDHNPSNFIDSVDNTYHGWMSGFCIEPSDDVQTCCLGFWLPSVLYGRIEERINLVQKGGSAFDVGSGWNVDCFLWHTSACGLAGAVTANRRTRVRGLYDINGTLMDDCVRGIFCNACTLMQIDREIRARSGKSSLCTSPDYKKTCSKIVSIQPAGAHYMSYAPMRGMEAREELEDVILCRKQLKPPLSASKKQGPAHFQCQLQVLPSISHIKQAIKPAAKCTPTELSATQEPNLKDKGDLIIKGVRQQSATSLSLDHKQNVAGLALTSGHSANFNDKRLGTSFKSFFGTIFKPSSLQTVLEDAAHQSPSVITSGVKGQDLTSPAPHDQQTFTAGVNHSIEECHGDSTALKLVHSTQVSEHSLVDCESVVIVNQRSPGAALNQLSYAHDFTDCPINGDMLDYIERQELKSNSHKLQDCPVENLHESASLKEASKKCVNEGSHRSDQGASGNLAECQINTAKSTKRSLSKKKGCKLARQRSAKSESPHQPAPVDESTRQPPSPAACCIEDSPQISRVEEHHLADCETPVLATPLDQAAEETETTSMKFSPVISSEVCCELSPPLVVTKQHKLSQCSRSSSMSAAALPQHLSHRLSQCTRSSSMPLPSTMVDNQHGLEDCSRPLSILDERNAVMTHTMTECEPQEIFEGSDLAGTESGTDPLPNSTADSTTLKKHEKAKAHLAKGKGKESTFDEPICNVPGHVEAEVFTANAEPELETKSPDVIVAVDVVVGGKKIRAKVVPVVEDLDVKTRQLRQNSAQQALKYVLASSAPEKRATSSKGSRKHPYQRYPRGNKARSKEDGSHAEDSTVVVLGTPGPESIAAHEASKHIKRDEGSQGVGQGIWSTLSGFIGGKEGEIP